MAAADLELRQQICIALTEGIVDQDGLLAFKAEAEERAKSVTQARKDEMKGKMSAMMDKVENLTELMEGIKGVLQEMRASAPTPVAEVEVSEELQTLYKANVKKYFDANPTHNPAGDDFSADLEQVMKGIVASMMAVAFTVRNK